MQTTLITAAVAGLVLVVGITALVLSGWFPRLAALAANGLERLFSTGEPLTPRERAEIVARLWVP